MTRAFGSGYLSVGLAVILTYVGLKMCVEQWLHIPVVLPLGIIALVLAASMVASLVRPAQTTETIIGDE